MAHPEEELGPKAADPAREAAEGGRPGADAGGAPAGDQDRHRDDDRDQVDLSAVTSLLRRFGRRVVDPEERESRREGTRDQVDLGALTSRLRKPRPPAGPTAAGPVAPPAATPDATSDATLIRDPVVGSATDPGPQPDTGPRVRDDRAPDRDQVDFGAVTAYLRRRRIIPPAKVKAPILVPRAGRPAGPPPSGEHGQAGLPADATGQVALATAPAITDGGPDQAVADREELTPAIEWIRRRDPVRWALGAMIVAWSLIFIHLGFQRHDRYGTFGFDLGIYDQAIWLLSRFETPFMTVRGLDFWGHHANPILLLFVPFYWLGAGPHFLLVAQVASQGVGAVAVYLLARDLLKARWPAVVMAGVLLLHPTYQYLPWEFFHPDALALGPVLMAYWAARTKRWKWFAVCLVLAIACKEDVALAAIVLGILIAARGDRRIGLVTSALAAVWFMIATRMIIPFANGIGPFYDTFFGEFGSSAGEVTKNVLTKPGKTFEVATRPTRMDYYRMMFAPVAFLPLAAIPTLFIAAPMLGINVLSSFPYQQEIRYHYAALVVAGIILATVEAIARLGPTPTARSFLVGLVAATSLASTVAWGPSPIGVKYTSGLWQLYPDARQEAKDSAVALIPADAPASVHFNYAPHMTHRKQIYEWPAPWEPANWGVKGENLHDPADVEWLLLDRGNMGVSDKPLLDRLLSTGEFVIVTEDASIMVAKRARPPSPGA